MSKRVSAELFSPVETRRTLEDVVQQIVEKIRDGDVDEGEMLPAERQLAAAMQVSRRTVRAAAATLAEMGAIEILPGASGGMRVVSRWVDATWRQPNTELAADEIFELLEARRTLEPRVAQLAGMRGTDEDFNAMRRAIELQRSVTEDRTRLLQANALFHKAMWRAARNSVLEQAMSAIYDKLEIALDMTSRNFPDAAGSLLLHERTLAAVRRGRLEDIDEVMDAHMSYLEEICEDVFDRSQVRATAPFLIPGRAAS